MNQPIPATIRILLSTATIAATLPGAVRAHPGFDAEMRAVNAGIAANPRDAALALRRGELRRLSGDFAAARADYDRARRLDPDLAAVDLCLGTMLVQEGRPKEALRALDRFLARQPEHAGALATRGRARLVLGDPAAAVKDFTRAIDRAPERLPPSPDLYLDRARALASLGEGRMDEAIRGLDEGIARLGDPVALELYAIELEVRRGRTGAALARLDQIAARSPRKETWLARRGAILEGGERKAEAREAYEGARDAIGALPPSRRNTRATARLETEIAAALARLGAAAPGWEARAP